jgi:hypothetical protein
MHREIFVAVVLEADDSLSPLGHPECRTWRYPIIPDKSGWLESLVYLLEERLDIDLVEVDLVSGSGVRVGV